MVFKVNVGYFDPFQVNLPKVFFGPIFFRNFQKFGTNCSKCRSFDRINIKFQGFGKGGQALRKLHFCAFSAKNAACRAENTKTHFTLQKSHFSMEIAENHRKGQKLRVFNGLEISNNSKKIFFEILAKNQKNQKKHTFCP